MESSGLQAHQQLRRIATLTTPSSQIIPYGYCHCGCGNKTTLILQNYRKRGMVKGEPNRFIQGHQCIKRQIPVEAKPFKIEGVYCRLIPLTQGMHAIVDEVDYWELARFKWCALWAEGTKSFYAARSGLRENNEPAMIFMHRHLLGLEKGDPREGDHIISGRTWDNRRKNLRIGTIANNVQNSRKNARNTSGMKGVDWSKEDKTYRVRVMVSGRRINVGTNKDFHKACEMRIAAALKYHHEFANDGTNWQGKVDRALGDIQ